MSALSDELKNDPLARGYAGMTDRAAVTSLNVLNRPIDKSALSGDETFSVTDTTEWLALPASSQSLWVSFCARDGIDPFSGANVAFVTNLFGGGSKTLAALSVLRRTANGQSRAQELGVRVRVGEIQTARG